MQLTMAGEYAIRAMIHLASLPYGTTVRLSDISKQWGIPEPFLKKIATQLTTAGLVSTHRGMNGGIRLNRPGESLTVADVIEAVEGKIVLNKCLLHEGYCVRDSWCQVHCLWSEAQEKMLNVLRSQSLATLARESMRQKEAIEQAHLAERSARHL